MILQSTKYTCGPCSIVNALETLGVNVTEHEIASMSGACPVRGTSVARMLRTLRGLGYAPRELRPAARTRPRRVEVHEAAWEALRENLAQGSPVIISVDADSHWVVAAGMLGSRIAVIDSALGELVVYLERPEFMARWRSGRSKRPFYGIIVSKGEP